MNQVPPQAPRTAAPSQSIPPPPPPPVASPGRASTATTSLVASLAMLAQGTLGMIALVAWTRTPSIVSWRVLVAFVATLAAIAASAALWLAPSRKTAWFGLSVLVFSLLRLGSPDQWTGTSWAVLAVTAVLSLPLLRASFALS